MEIWVVAYRRFYKVFLVSMALFLGGNMVLQKIESRRRKNNSRQQNIIDYLLKGMLEELSNDKTTPHPPTGEFYQLPQLRYYSCLKY